VNGSGVIDFCEGYLTIGFRIAWELTFSDFLNKVFYEGSLKSYFAGLHKGFKGWVLLFREDCLEVLLANERRLSTIAVAPGELMNYLTLPIKMRTWSVWDFLVSNGE
jgi:hypothetical protein